jgi:hypothetical protein
LHGVNRQNAGEYEYRVMKGQKTIVPWAIPAKFTDAVLIKQSGMPQMAYLGVFGAPLGSMIIVDVRKKGTGHILATAVVAFVSIKPVLSNVYTANEFNIFLKRLARPYTAWQRDAEQSKWQKQNKAGYPPGKFMLGPTENNLVFYLDGSIYSKNQLEYQLTGKDKVVIKWKTNDFDNNFVWLKNLEPGPYRLSVRYTAQRQHISDFAFQIKTAWYQSNWFTVIAGILSCASLGFVVFFILHIKQKQRAEEELAKKTKLQLELKTIYAQLNPHFIFNALNSIQGLINKRDMEGANSYLTDFAKLMRASLNNSVKEQNSVNEEIAILATYLKLEQLRFGFKYKIEVDDTINVYETEIPALLLQPLVENAIKHGVSGLHEKGMVNINFSKENNHLTVIITDNGKGFAGQVNNNGFGLKLTNDRIKLQNELNKTQMISLSIKDGIPTGTQIEIIFKNWFL